MVFSRMLVFLLAVILPASAWGFDISDRVTEFTLSNGMNWFLVRRTGAPVFSGTLMVRAGSVDEKEGNRGVAHIFEHIAFKGSDRIGTHDFAKEKPILDEIEVVGQKLSDEQKKSNPDEARVKDLKTKLTELQKEADKYQTRNEVWEIMSRNGAADLNAYTSKDVTSYHASMPSNKLDLWARIMAEIAFHPVYREFYVERSVIAEERRSNTDNNPDGKLDEVFHETAFADGPYHWPTIGYEKDILGMTIADARQFHEDYYIPNNMIGVLVGNFEIAKAKEIIKEAFGSYSKGVRPPEPKQGKLQRGIIKQIKFNAEPSILIAYHKPTLPDPKEYIFNVINGILCAGSSSRLEKKLVYEKHLAQSVECSDSYPGSRLSNLFFMQIQPLKSVSPDSILKEVSLEMAKLQKEPVQKEELDRVRKGVTASIVFSLDKNENFVEQLASFQTIFGDWKLLTTYPEKIAAVGADDVMAIAKEYLNSSDRIVVERIKSK